MFIIILTGTIGSGKSTVSAILRELGAAVIDSDEVARHVLDPGTPAYLRVVEEFGPEILEPPLPGTSQPAPPEGSPTLPAIDRKKLAARVFNNPPELRKLNSITHPGVDAVVEELFKRYRREGKKAVFVEMAFLAAPRWQAAIDAYWVVKVSRPVALERLAKRGLSRSEALARLANQSDPEKQINGRLSVIRNDGDITELRKQVVNLWQKIDNENE